MTDSGSEIAETVESNRGWFIALGIILILVGIAAIAYPFLATLSTKIFVGWVLLIGGIIQIVHAFRVKGWGGFFWELIVGLLQTAAGVYLLAFPIAGIFTLTVFLAAIFVIEGIFRAALAFSIKPQSGWVWVLIGGIISIVVGTMIWAQFPSSALWAIGLLVGINIAMAGWSLLILALAAGDARDAAAKA